MIFDLAMPYLPPFEPDRDCRVIPHSEQVAFSAAYWLMNRIREREKVRPRGKLSASMIGISKVALTEIASKVPESAREFPSYPNRVQGSLERFPIFG